MVTNLDKHLSSIPSLAAFFSMFNLSNVFFTVSLHLSSQALFAFFREETPCTPGNLSWCSCRQRGATGCPVRVKVRFKTLITVPKRSILKKCLYPVSPTWPRTAASWNACSYCLCETTSPIFDPLNKFVWPNRTGRTWSHVGRKHVGRKHIRMYACPIGCKRNVCRQEVYSCPLLFLVGYT